MKMEVRGVTVSGGGERVLRGMGDWLLVREEEESLKGK